MSSQKTEHYELNQWLATDQVLRTDFNADNAKLDAALNTLAGQVAGKADATGLDALSGTVAGHTAQLAQKGNCQIYTTTYTGTGAVSRSFSFPQSPLLVVISGPEIHILATQGIAGTISVEAGECNRVTASWSGANLTLA